MQCDYDKTAAGHSALIGVALDGRGLYGLYETTGTVPTDLDWCGGHTGNVPAWTATDGSASYPAATSVYHCKYCGSILSSIPSQGLQSVRICTFLMFLFLCHCRPHSGFCPLHYRMLWTCHLIRAVHEAVQHLQGGCHSSPKASSVVYFSFFYKQQATLLCCLFWCISSGAVHVSKSFVCLV